MTPERARALRLLDLPASMWSEEGVALVKREFRALAADLEAAERELVQAAIDKGDARGVIEEQRRALEAAERNMRRLADKNVEIQRWADEKIQAAERERDGDPKSYREELRRWGGNIPEPHHRAQFYPTPEREKALRTIRDGIRADSCQHSNDGILKDVANEALDALAADLEAAERDRDEWEERSHRFEHRAYDAERDLATAREALDTLATKRITDAEGWATWAKNVARRALRSLNMSDELGGH